MQDILSRLEAENIEMRAKLDKMIQKEKEIRAMIKLIALSMDIDLAVENDFWEFE